MFASFNKVKVKAITGVVGKNRIDTYKQGQLLNIDSKRLSRLVKTNGFTGVCEVSPEITMGDLFSESVSYLLRSLNLSSKSIDSLILITQNPDYIIPSTSYSIQQKIGLSKETILIDILQGCPATVMAMLQGAALIESGVCRNVLIGAGDLSCHFPSSETSHPENYLINGDGCGLILLSYSEEPANLHFQIHSHGEKWDTVIDYSSGIKASKNPEKAKTGFFIDGVSMDIFALDTVSSEIKNFLCRCNMDFNDISYCIAQQSNKTMLKALSSVLDISSDKIPFMASDLGNLSSASIPVVLSLNFRALSDIREKPVLLSAYGVGLGTSLCVADLSETMFFEPILL